jgi:hypothetical protein
MNRLRHCGIYTQWNFTHLQRKNEIMLFTSKWMELEKIILSEVTKTQKAKSPIFSLIFEI